MLYLLECMVLFLHSSLSSPCSASIHFNVFVFHSVYSYSPGPHSRTGYSGVQTLFSAVILSEDFLAPHCQTIIARDQCSHNFVLFPFLKVQSPKNLLWLMISRWKTLCSLSETIFSQILSKCTENCTPYSIYTNSFHSPSRGLLSVFCCMCM